MEELCRHRKPSSQCRRCQRRAIRLSNRDQARAQLKSQPPPAPPAPIPREEAVASADPKAEAPKAEPPPKQYAAGATTRHAGQSHLKKRASGVRSTKNRFRLTRAVARTQKNEKLIDLFESAKAVISVEASDPGTIGPVDLAKANREHSILRTELLRRGFEPELLDWTGEELNESEEVVPDEAERVEELVNA
jgi:hypothetical protein